MHELKEVATKNHKLKVITYLTRGERIDIDTTGIANATGNVDSITGQVKMEKFFNRRASEEKLIKIVIKQFDGTDMNEQIVTKILDELPETDADEIFEVIDKITNPKKDKKKS
jgi:hypothetical protein